MAQRNRPPSHLPSGVRDHPQLIAACRDRDLGMVFRLVNNLTDGPERITASHLARLCGMSPSRVGDYMANRHQATSAEVLERVADGLRIPGERFGLGPRPWEPKAELAIRHPPVADLQPTATQQPAPHHGSSDAALSYAASLSTTLMTVAELGRQDVHRRSFLLTSSYLVAALAPSSRDWLLASLEAADADTPRTISHEHVDAIRRTFAEFQQQDVIGGGGHEVRRTVAAYLTDVVLPMVRQPQSPSVQQALYEVASEQTYLAGWMSFDSGAMGLAQRYLIQALRLAQASGNRVLGAHVLAGMSDQATQLGFPEEGLRLAQAGRHGLRGLDAPAATTDLLVLEARAYAAMGNAMSAVHAIDDTERMFDRINPDDEAEWARFIDEAYITGEIANSLRDLRDSDNAERFAAQSIAACRRQGRARRASLSYATLAASHVERRDMEAAADAASRSLDLASGVPSIRCTIALADVRGRLAPHASNKAVGGFMDQLSASARL